MRENAARDLYAPGEVGVFCVVCAPSAQRHFTVAPARNHWESLGVHSRCASEELAGDLRAWTFETRGTAAP